MENKELKLYDIDSIELYELIDSSRIKLKRNNLEYKNLYEQFKIRINICQPIKLLIKVQETVELNN